jgi:hypothetical protein
MGVGERPLNTACLEELGREIASEMVCLGREIDMAVSFGWSADRTLHRWFNRTSALGIVRFHLTCYLEK